MPFMPSRPTFGTDGLSARQTKDRMGMTSKRYYLKNIPPGMTGKRYVEVRLRCDVVHLPNVLTPKQHYQ
jgi:hypothetical protein